MTRRRKIEPQNNKMRLPLVAVSLAGLMLACAFEQREHLRDAELVSNFSRNRSAFDQLLRMATEDRQLNRVAMDFVWNMERERETRDPGIPQQLWDQYRRLFREADVPDGFLRPAMAGDLIEFFSSTQGTVSGGTAKGYAFSSQPLEPLVESLDQPERLSLAATPTGDSAYVALCSRGSGRMVVDGRA